MSMTSRKRTDGSKPELLFKHKSGGVQVTVFGPRIGWGWNQIDYFRWTRSTREPGKWEKRLPDRRDDQPHLLACVRAVIKWQKQYYAPATLPE